MALHITKDLVKFLSTIFVTLAYVLLFCFLYNLFGKQVGVVVVLPVSIIGIYFGLRWGITAGVLSLPVNMVLYSLLGEGSFFDMLGNYTPGSFFGFLGIIFIGGTVGRMHDLSQKAQHSMKDQKTAEDALRKSQESLTRIVAEQTAELKNEIVERKRIETALRESEEKFRAIADSSTDAIVTSDADAVIIYCNKAASEMYGYEVQELLGQSSAMLMVSDNIRVEQNGRRDFNETGSSSFFDKPFESIGKKKTGAEFPVEISISTWETAGLYFYSAIIRDITARKQYEIELREKEGRLQLALDAAKAGMWTWDLQTNALFWDNRMQELLGFKPGTFNGTYEAWQERIHPEDIAALNSAILNASQTGEHLNHQYRARGRGGAWIHISTQATNVPDDTGQSAMMVGMSADVTENKNLREQLNQNQKMESIGTLAGGIAHDFNNILGAIIGYTELSLDDVEDRPETHQSIQQVLIAAQRARDLVAQILAFSRSANIEKKPIKAVPIVKEVCKFIRSSLPTTIKIIQHTPIKHDRIMADPTQFHQILMNLCTNAGHAMQMNGGTLEVLLEEVFLHQNDSSISSQLKSGPFLRLTVKDTGHGISKENLVRIFEPYFTTKGQGEGTGLGLAVVHGIVKDHGGDINAYSEIGKGTMFNVLLPLIDVNEETADNIKTASLPTGNETILFVDDEQELVNLSKRLFERLGYKVVTHTNPEKALAEFKQSADSYDLVITDKTMPHLTGYDLSREILSIKSDIPIILCTGFCDKTDLTKAEEVGIREFIMKPINKHQMAETIRKVLDKKDCQPGT